MTIVLDASAVLALLREEPGADHVRGVIESAHPSAAAGSYLSAVNLTEVFQRVGGSLPPVMNPSNGVIVTVSYDAEQAAAAAAMFTSTRSAGLGIADRACLGLARTMGLPALTADRAWSDLDIGVEIIQVR